MSRCQVFIVLAVAAAIGAGLLGHHEGPGIIAGAAVPAQVIDTREQRQELARNALGVDNSKQILFGDFHTHTTLSMDAFLTSLDFAVGEGSHPQADACDFAHPHRGARLVLTYLYQLRRRQTACWQLAPIGALNTQHSGILINGRYTGTAQAEVVLQTGPDLVDLPFA